VNFMVVPTGREQEPATFWRAGSVSALRAQPLSARRSVSARRHAPASDIHTRYFVLSPRLLGDVADNRCERSGSATSPGLAGAALRARLLLLVRELGDGIRLAQAGEVGVSLPVPERVLHLPAVFRLAALQSLRPQGQVGPQPPQCLLAPAGAFLVVEFGCILA